MVLQKKILLMGPGRGGKTSIRNIIFGNYLPRDTVRLGTTIELDQSQVTFLGHLSISLFDCGGQLQYVDHYMLKQTKYIFTNVDVLIFVFDINALTRDDSSVGGSGSGDLDSTGCSKDDDFDNNSNNNSSGVITSGGTGSEEVTAVNSNTQAHNNNNNNNNNHSRRHSATHHPLSNVDSILLGNIGAPIDNNNNNNIRDDDGAESQHSIGVSSTAFRRTFGGPQGEWTKRAVMEYFKACVKNLNSYSPEAKVICLLNKIDLVGINDREDIINMRKLEITRECPTAIRGRLQFFGTTIWDDTLFTAWSNIMGSLVPCSTLLREQIGIIMSGCEATEVAVFEKTTFLCIAHVANKEVLDEARTALLGDDKGHEERGNKRITFNNNINNKNNNNNSSNNNNVNNIVGVRAVATSTTRVKGQGILSSHNDLADASYLKNCQNMNKSPDQDINNNNLLLGKQSEYILVDNKGIPTTTRVSTIIKKLRRNLRVQQQRNTSAIDGIRRVNTNNIIINKKDNDQDGTDLTVKGDGGNIVRYNSHQQLDSCVKKPDNNSFQRPLDGVNTNSLSRDTSCINSTKNIHSTTVVPTTLPGPDNNKLPHNNNNMIPPSSASLSSSKGLLPQKPSAFHLQFSTREFAAIIDQFTEHTFIMIITHNSPVPVALTQACLRAGKGRFGALLASSPEAAGMRDIL